VSGKKERTTFCDPELATGVVVLDNWAGDSGTFVSRLDGFQSDGDWVDAKNLKCSTQQRLPHKPARMRDLNAFPPDGHFTQAALDTCCVAAGSLR
jgi:hypothetical protein